MTVQQLHPAGDYVSDYIRRTGWPYELDILEELEARLRGGAGTIVDAGAHIGNHTAWLAARLPDYQVHAFEPWPASFDLLAANTIGTRNVQLHRLALSNISGGIYLGQVDNNPGHVRELEDDEQPAGGFVNASRRPLDGLNLQDVRLIKIDVEGHEAQVMAGAAATIERDRPLICLEDWTLETPYPAVYELRVAWPNQQTYLIGPSERDARRIAP